MFGLKEENIQTIQLILNHHPEVEEALIFGSRATGTYRRGSDVDIALKGKKVSHFTIVSIGSKLNEETMMPYRFDLVNYNTLKNNELTDHINRVGKLVYTPRAILPLQLIRLLDETGFPDPQVYLREQLLHYVKTEIYQIENQIKNFQDKYQTDFEEFEKQHINKEQKNTQEWNDYLQWQSLRESFRYKNNLLTEITDENKFFWGDT